MMAFDLRNLSRLCYGNGFTLWAYRAMPGENMTLTDATAYFAGARTTLNNGDAIMVSDDRGTELVTPFPRNPAMEMVEEAEDGVFVTRHDLDTLDEWIEAEEALPRDDNPYGRGYDTGVVLGAKIARAKLLGDPT